MCVVAGSCYWSSVLLSPITKVTGLFRFIFRHSHGYSNPYMLLLSGVTITVTHDFTETEHFYQQNMYDLIWELFF